MTASFEDGGGLEFTDEERETPNPMIYFTHHDLLMYMGLTIAFASFALAYRPAS